MVRRVESHLRGFAGAGAEGPRLFRRAWLPDAAERVLVLVHGYAEHSGRYEHVGRWFSERGYAVHAYDHRGHGRSSGLRCHVDAFSEFTADLDLVLAAVRESHPELPLILFGHSMGGLIVTAYVVDQRPGLTAAVTSGAALSVSPALSRVRIAAARLLRRLAPRFVLGSGLDPSGLSRDPAVVRGYLEDPLVQRTMTASLAAALIQAVEETADRALDVQVPMMMLHGEEDPICPVDGTRSFYAGLHVARSVLRTYPGLRHEILNEPEQGQILEDVHAWVTALAERGEGAAHAARGAS
jgi:alpha-beta hydrolase superfamily lysophospholipase